MENKSQLPHFLMCAFCALTIGLVTGYIAGMKHGRPAAAETKTVTTDSVKSSEPAPSAVRNAGFVTVPVRIGLPDPEEPSDLPADSLLVFTPASLPAILRDAGGYVAAKAEGVADSVGRPPEDSAVAILPLTQKVYRDSLYTAYVSGFRPRLDSITLRQRTVTVRQTVTLPQPATKRSRFTFGLTVGAGYGLFTRKPDVFVGAGFAVRL